MSKGLKSDSTARNHVCLGRPTGRLQSGGGFWIAAETAWWWSWIGELCAMWPKNRSFYLLPLWKRPTV